MLNDWLNHATRLALEPAHYWAGCRKIIRGVVLDFPNGWQPSLRMESVGYNARAKMKQLERGYYNEESVKAALDLWAERRRKGSYGSLGICTYNHYIKFSAKKDMSVEEFKKERKGKVHGSIMGPCIQSILITQVKREQVSIDISYRTTEFFKKFPADLVFVRDRMLPQFNLPEIIDTRMYFANVTMHPMYAFTMAPHLEKGIGTIAFLERVRKKDKKFWEWIVKWNARYLVKRYSRGVEKFAQAQRVKEGIIASLPASTVRELRTYLDDNYPTNRGPVTEENDED